MVKFDVPLCSIMEYIGARSRPLKEGEAVFKAGHIILCGPEASDLGLIRSLCLQTSSLTSQPHEISICLDEDIKKWKCVCSCKAGMSGFCKHIIATLININRNEELEVVSCTDLEQKWGKEKKGVEEIYKAQPFKEFCHPKVKRKKLTFITSPNLDAGNFDILSSGIADSALGRFLGRSLNASDSGCASTDNMVTFKESDFQGQVQILLKSLKTSKFLNNIKFSMPIDELHNNLRPCCQDIVNTLSTSNVLDIATKYEQGSPMWAKERQLRITGSTCYSIHTFKKNEEWEQKSKKFFFPKHFTNKFVEHGRRYEKEALKAFIEKYNVSVITPGFIISTIFPWLGFSPDGVIFENGVPSKLLEIKCPFVGKDNLAEIFPISCEFLEKDEMKLKERHAYYGQVQMGMALLGLETSTLLLYSSFSKSFLEIEIPFNEEFASELIKNVSIKYFTEMLHFYCLNKT